MMSKAKAFARKFGSLARVKFVASLPCCGCRHPGPNRNHHVRTAQNSGTGYKPDAKYIVPLCDKCHHELHQHGAETFERRHLINLLEIAAKVEELWQQYEASWGIAA